MRTWFFSVFLGLLSITSYAQKSFVEIPIFSTLDLHIQPIDSSGFNFTTYDIRNTVDQERRVDLKRYFFNDQFELLSESSIEIPKGYGSRPLKVWNQDGSYYLFISSIGESLMVVHLKPDGTNIRQKVPFLEVKYVQYFDAFEDQVLFSVKIDSKPTVFLFDLQEGRLKTLEGFYEKGLRLLDCGIDHENRLINIIKEEVKRNDRVLVLKNYSFEGQLLREVELDVPDKQRLNTVSISSIQNGVQFIVGNYRNTRKQGTTGSYIAKVDQDGRQLFNFIPYFRMKGYQSSIREDRSERKKIRAERRYSKKGSWSTADKLRLSDPFLVNDKIHIVTVHMVNNTYRQQQMIFKESTEFLGLINMPVYEWGSLDWASDDEFITLNRESLTYYITKTIGKEVNTYAREINSNFLPEGSSDLLVEMTKHWYKNTILVGISYKLGGRMFYTISSQNIDLN